MRLSIFIISVVGLTLASCGKETDANDIYSDFPNQNIPSELCGTWKEIMCGREYFVSMTINPDGKINAEYYSIYDGPTVLKGKCFYNDGIIKFYRENARGEWSDYGLMGIEIDGDRAVPFIDWTSSTLVLIDRYTAHLMSRNDVVPATYQGTNRPSYMIGGWKYWGGRHAMDLNQDGTGTRYYNGGSTGFYPVDVSNWFVWNGHFYIKDGEGGNYDVFDIVESNNKDCLYWVKETSKWFMQKE